MLGPDAAVDDSDDDVLSGAGPALARGRAAELGPQTARGIQPEEGGCGRRVERLLLVLAHGDDALLLLQRVRLRGRQLGAEAVERVDVVVELLTAACLRERRGVRALQVVGVLRAPWSSSGRSSDPWPASSPPARLRRPYRRLPGRRASGRCTCPSAAALDAVAAGSTNTPTASALTISAVRNRICASPFRMCTAANGPAPEARGS